MWLPSIRPPLRYGLRVLRVVLVKFLILPCGVFNFTLRRNQGGLNCYVASTYPSSTSLRTTGFETGFEAILRGTLC